MNSGPASVAGWVDFSAIARRKYMNSGPASVAGWVDFSAIAGRKCMNRIAIAQPLLQDGLTSQLLQGGSV